VLPQTAIIHKEVLTVHQITLLPHTAFLQICLLANFLFPGQKRALKGYRCIDIQTVQKAVTKQLCRVLEWVFQDCFEDPPKMKEIIDAGGRYSEGDPDWKHAVLIISSVSELCGRMFKLYRVNVNGVKDDENFL